MSLTTGTGKESYVQHIWRGLKSKGAAHVWIALGFVYSISEVQTADHKALCTRKVLQPHKSKFYRGFPVSRPILNSYTKPTLLHAAHPYCHYVWTLFITVSVTCFTDTVVTVTGIQDPERTY